MNPFSGAAEDHQYLAEQRSPHVESSTQHVHVLAPLVGSLWKFKLRIHKAIELHAPSLKGKGGVSPQPWANDVRLRAFTLTPHHFPLPKSASCVAAARNSQPGSREKFNRPRYWGRAIDLNYAFRPRESFEYI